MLLQIIQHTPVWVWGLLAALVALGASQTRDRDVTLTRVTVLPFVLLALSFAGVSSAFGGVPAAFGAWAIGLAAALFVARRFIPVRGASWSASSRLLHVPGSWLPLTLILSLFALKYFVGVSLAMQPGLSVEPQFAICCGLAYGVFSGIFLGRALSLRSVVGSTRVLSAV